jgi:hypothetical protein
MRLHLMSAGGSVRTTRPASSARLPEPERLAWTRLHRVRVGAVLLIASVPVAAAAGCGGRTALAPLCNGPAPVTFADEDPAHLPAEVRACAFDVSCASTRWWWTDRQPGQQPRSCLSDMQLNGLDGPACAPNAASCDQWLACATHGHCAAWCQGQGLAPDSVFPLWTCDGDDLVVCGGGSDYGVVFERCAPEGMHCERAGYGASCTDGHSCSMPTDTHCDGNRVVSCDSSTLLESSEDCTAEGAVCTMPLGQLSVAGCVPTADTCTPQSDPAHCEGTRWAGCFLGSRVQIDCAGPDFAGTCGPTDHGPDCIPAAHECTAETPDACDGVDFVTCGTDQRLWRVDCTTLGLRTCGTVDGRAACVP